MKLARIIRLDDSDAEVYARPAAAGEWAIPGTFEFSNWTESDLTGQNAQAFAHGWLGLDGFGRGTVAAVSPITEAEAERLRRDLAGWFIAAWGAPDIDAAYPVAAEEIAHMISLCEEHPENTLMLISRELSEAGVRDRFRIVPPQGASIEAFAVHGD